MDYQDIYPDWMNYEDLYDKAVKEAQDGAAFLELGCFLGRSTVYMATQIRDNEKIIDFIAVDKFGRHEDDKNTLQTSGDKFKTYCENLQKCGVEKYVTTIKATTEEACKFLKGNGVKFDFIFIDASHTYDGVLRDIEDAKALIKPGGTIAGHDYNLNDVRDAVNDSFKWNMLSFFENCWIYKKPLA